MEPIKKTVEKFIARLDALTEEILRLEGAIKEKRAEKDAIAQQLTALYEQQPRPVTSAFAALSPKNKTAPTAKASGYYSKPRKLINYMEAYGKERLDIVYDTLKEHGPMTASQLAPFLRAYSLHGKHVSGALSELFKAQRVTREVSVDGSGTFLYSV